MSSSGFLLEVFQGALYRLLSFDAQTFSIFWLTLQIGVVATVVGMTISLPLAWYSSRSKSGVNSFLTLLFQALAAVPTVIVGTVVYLFLSRRGPLGALELLYTPTAIIIGDVLLIIPLTTIFLKTTFESLQKGLLETAENLGASPWQVFLLACREKRHALIAGFCFSFGRVISEIGCAMILGGNIKGLSRTLTTAMALEIGKGESEEAIALGILLLFLALGNAYLLHRLNQTPRKKTRAAHNSEEQSAKAPALLGKDDRQPPPTLKPLECLHLTKHFHEKTIFSDLTFSLEMTGGTAILGPSGVGKSTLFRMIAGLATPDAGTIETQNRQAVLIFQRPYLFSGTVRENLAFGLQLRKVPHTGQEKIIAPLAQSLGIQHLLDRQTTNLSGGESARVSLGRALAISPQILLLDETLVHLDSVSLAAIIQVLQHFIRQGGGLILITHQAHIATTICQRRLLLQNGKLQEISA